MKNCWSRCILWVLARSIVMANTSKEITKELLNTPSKNDGSILNSVTTIVAMINEIDKYFENTPWIDSEYNKKKRIEYFNNLIVIFSEEKYIEDFIVFQLILNKLIIERDELNQSLLAMYEELNKTINNIQNDRNQSQHSDALALEIKEIERCIAELQKHLAILSIKIQHLQNSIAKVNIQIAHLNNNIVHYQLQYMAAVSAALNKLPPNKLYNNNNRITRVQILITPKGIGAPYTHDFNFNHEEMYESNTKRFVELYSEAILKGEKDEHVSEAKTKFLEHNLNSFRNKARAECAMIEVTDSNLSITDQDLNQINNAGHRDFDLLLKMAKESTNEERNQLNIGIEDRDTLLQAKSDYYNNLSSANNEINMCNENLDALNNQLQYANGQKATPNSFAANDGLFSHRDTANSNNYSSNQEPNESTRSTNSSSNTNGVKMRRT